MLLQYDVKSVENGTAVWSTSVGIYARRKFDVSTVRQDVSLARSLSRCSALLVAVRSFAWALELGAAVATIVSAAWSVGRSVVLPGSQAWRSMSSSTSPSVVKSLLGRWTYTVPHSQRVTHADVCRVNHRPLAWCRPTDHHILSFVNRLNSLVPRSLRSSMPGTQGLHRRQLYIRVDVSFYKPGFCSI